LCLDLKRLSAGVATVSSPLAPRHVAAAAPARLDADGEYPLEALRPWQRHQRDARLCCLLPRGLCRRGRQRSPPRSRRIACTSRRSPASTKFRESGVARARSVLAPACLRVFPARFLRLLLRVRCALRDLAAGRRRRRRVRRLALRRRPACRLRIGRPFVVLLDPLVAALLVLMLQRGIRDAMRAAAFAVSVDG